MLDESQNAAELRDIVLEKEGEEEKEDELEDLEEKDEAEEEVFKLSTLRQDMKWSDRTFQAFSSSLGVTGGASNLSLTSRAEEEIKVMYPGQAVASCWGDGVLGLL